MLITQICLNLKKNTIKNLSVYIKNKKNSTLTWGESAAGGRRKAAMW